MARRRPLTGHPLLVAAGGLVLTVGCSAGNGAGPESYPPPGNLMPPPAMVTGELCVETVPEKAEVVVNGASVPLPCAPVTVPDGAQVLVSVSAPGYEPASQTVPFAPKMAIKVTLDVAAPPPVGNLVAPPIVAPPPPPPPPPVGNLMPPPPRDPPPKPQ